MSIINEAFAALEELDEQIFSLSEADITDDDVFDNLETFLDTEEESEDGDTAIVIDPIAETEDELEDSYVGKCIIKCEVCGSLQYVNPEEITIEEDSNIVGMDIECPLCYSNEGYTIIGKVAEFTEDEEPEEEVEIEVEEEPVEVEPTEEPSNEEEIEEGCGKKAKKHIVKEECHDELTEAIDNILNKLNEAEISPEDKADSDILRAIRGKRTARSNAKLTDEEKAVLAKYNLDTSGGTLFNKDTHRTIADTSWDTQKRIKKMNLADRARKVPERTYAQQVSRTWVDDSIYDHASNRGKTNTFQNKERGLENTELGRDYADVKANLSSKSWHKRELGNVDDEYDKKQQNLLKQLKDNEARRVSVKNLHTKGAEIADNNIKSILARKKAKRNNANEALNEEKYVIWNQLGRLKGTGEANFNSFIRNERRVHDLSAFDTPQEVIDKYKELYGMTDDDFIVITEGLKLIDDVNKNLDEALKVYTTIDEYKPWSGAIDTWETIVDNNMADTLESILEDMYPEGISMTELNDLLWFEPETVLGDWLGLDVEEDIEESLTEDIDHIEITTDEETMVMDTKEDGGITIETTPTEEVIAPLDDSDVEEIEEINDETIEDEIEEEPMEDEMEVEEDDFDEFDEESFDELGESYLKNIYSNVTNFKTNGVSQENDRLVVEGVITFESGKAKKTSFIFEAKETTKRGKMKFLGENLEITGKDKKAFTLTTSIKDSKLVSESLNYNYRIKDENGKSHRLYGTMRKA